MSNALTHGERRELFTRLYAELILEVHRRVYQCRNGETLRATVTAIIYGYSPEQCDRLEALLRPGYPEIAAAVRAVRRVAGSMRSVHPDGTAGDLLIFLNGDMLDRSKDYEQFGTWWESQHPLCRWGGRWGDGNHFSVMMPDGRR